MKDKKYDDYGSGKIVYPTKLGDEKGLFDIVEFSVKNNKSEYLFEYELANINNNYSNANGFSNILIDTYISVDKTGLLNTYDYGAAITFNENYPWKYHLRITPEEHYVEKVTDLANRITEKIDSDLILEGKVIKVLIKKESISENLKKSKYYVFTGGYDILGSDNYREVVKDEDEWNFSGGIDSLYQPNVLDVVNPVQEQMLLYFMPPTYAILSPVYNQLHEALIKKEYIYILIFIFFGYNYRYTYRLYKKELKKEKDAF